MGRERDLERRIVRAVRARDGIALKLIPSVDVGLPDRLIILPGGNVWFVELKANKHSRRTPKQRWWEMRLEKLGVRYLCTYSFDHFSMVVLGE